MAAIQVRALRTGFYYGLRKAGSVFTLHDETALGAWVEPVDPVIAAKYKDSQDKKRQGRRDLPRVAAPGVPPTSGVLRSPIGPPASVESKPETPPADPAKTDPNALG